MRKRRSGAVSRSWSTTRRQPLQQRNRDRRQGGAGALLPQDAPLGAGRAVGAGQRWHPGCDGPNGSKVALIICHDGMFPEMARECAYKGANIMLRTAGYTAPISAFLAHHQPSERLLQPHVHRERVHGRNGRRLQLDGRRNDRELRRHAARSGQRVPTKSSPARSDPSSREEARRAWGVENNIYQFGHRGFVAVLGGAQDCPYTYMHDLMSRKYRVPWEDEVLVTDGISCGFPRPNRHTKVDRLGPATALFDTKTRGAEGAVRLETPPRGGQPFKGRRPCLERRPAHEKITMSRRMERGQQQGGAYRPPPVRSTCRPPAFRRWA